MKKTICCDATHLGTEQPTGVERYVDFLLPLLTEKLVAQGCDVLWIGHSTVSPVRLPEGAAWISSPPVRFWSQTGLLAVLKQRVPDLFFSPSGLVPLRYLGNTAITVHDMAVYTDAASFSFSQKLRLKTLSSRIAGKTAGVLTPSLYTKEQILRYWSVPEDRIRVTPLGYAAETTAPEPVPNLPLDGSLILYVGRIERKKNLATFIRGFAQLDPALGARLVLAGRDGFGSSEIRRGILKLPDEIRRRVVLTGYVSDGQKVALYSQAQAVVCPCPTEGFGLPVLEAFAAAVPVVCAQAGSLPEVAGDASLYAQYDIAADWKLRLETLIKDDAVSRELVTRGTTRLKHYDWDTTAKATTEALISWL